MLPVWLVLTPRLPVDLMASSGKAKKLCELRYLTSRLASLRVSASSSFDGLLRPGDRVDVVHTTERPGSGERVTTSLLQNVLVLATPPVTANRREVDDA